MHILTLQHMLHITMIQFCFCVTIKNKFNINFKEDLVAGNQDQVSFIDQTLLFLVLKVAEHNCYFLKIMK